MHKVILLSLTLYFIAPPLSASHPFDELPGELSGLVLGKIHEEDLTALGYNPTLYEKYQTGEALIQKHPNLKELMETCIYTAYRLMYGQRWDPEALRSSFFELKDSEKLDITPLKGDKFLAERRKDPLFPRTRPPIVVVALPVKELLYYFRIAEFESHPFLADAKYFKPLESLMVEGFERPGLLLDNGIRCTTYPEG